MTAAALELAPGGEATPVALEGELLTVEAAGPLPPGTRVELREPGAGRLLALGKVADLRPSGAGARLRVRLFAPERWARARLEELVRDRAGAPHQKNEPPR